MTLIDVALYAVAIGLATWHACAAYVLHRDAGDRWFTAAYVGGLLAGVLSPGPLVLVVYLGAILGPPVTYASLIGYPLFRRTADCLPGALPVPGRPTPGEPSDEPPERSTTEVWTASRTCPDCGLDLEDYPGASVCPECGRRLEPKGDGRGRDTR